ncbi:MAG TPA: GDSL-type esterase/lipase family protein [Saprospiraceae bacterium]|nr:GDSL-type esterase/lipase family protein [Saprospiraceae bacterium]
MKNYLPHTLLLPLLLLLLLIGLSFLPRQLSVWGVPLRPVDIFSDLRSDSLLAQQAAAPAAADTVPPALPDTAGWAADAPPPMTDSVGPLPPKDSAFFGKTIEDYTPDQQGLRRFFASVDSIRAGRKVRVAWFGDSFVEGDILLGDLRDTLQSLWGGAGVGFVPITSEVAQFKRTLKHQYKGWSTYSIVKKAEQRPPLGINGYAYRPGPEAKVHYEAADYFRHTRQFVQFRLFYTSEAGRQFVWQIQDGEPRTERLPAQPGGRLGVWTWEERYPGTRAVAARFPETEGLMLYGGSFENGPGFYIDNFSVRGNTGGPLKLLHPDLLRQFDAAQRYDLVVLQVGLNAVTHSLDNIKWYRAELERTYAHLRRCFPGQPILIVSVGDRADKLGTELATMRSVPVIVAMQRTLAREFGFLFYDLYWGMGGPGSMIEMANHRPRYANLDYTHLTHDGGRYVGLRLAQVFLQEKERWRALR